jgi:hypothetical protein
MNEENAGPVSEVLAKAIDCANWPDWLHDTVNHVTREADEGTDLSTEQCIAFGALLTLRAADHPAVGVTVKALEWARFGWVEAFAAPQGLGVWYAINALDPKERTPPYTLKVFVGTHSKTSTSEMWVDGGTFHTVEAAKAAAFDHYRSAILSCIEPLRPATEQAGGEVVAYRRPRVPATDGNGKWHYCDAPRPVVTEDMEGLVLQSSLLRTSPPSPAATQSAVVSDEMAANIAERILRNVRRFIAAENKHARLLSNPETELATSRDEADRENADLLGFTLDQVDQALRIVGRRLSALSNPGASQ